jgi:uncharacterized protein YdaU (DUF1376 family)
MAKNWVKRLKKNVKSALTGKAGHSKAGKKHLKAKKKKTESVYFKGIKRKSANQRLKDAGLSKSDLKSLGIK